LSGSRAHQPGRPVDAAGFSASADIGTGTLIEYVLTGLTPPPL
jgi:hypothetical protein